MAEVQAGQQQEGQEQLEGEQATVEGEGEPKPQPAERTYTQAELDRILGKVRKNARYLGRKEAEAELVARGASRQQAEQAVEREQPKAPVAPKREDFENYEDFLDAKTDFRARQVSREEREKADSEARTRRIAEERQTSDREFRKHADAVMKEIPDFAEVIESAENVMITEAMGEAITEAGALGPRILYHLVQNPDDAERISAIKSKAAQAREIGKLEARIEAELKAKVKAKPQGEEGAEGEDEQEGEEREEVEGDDKPDTQRRADGTFKPAKKRAAPEPIEPGSARSAAGSSRLPSDKDDIVTWNRKMDELERQGKR